MPRNDNSSLPPSDLAGRVCGTNLAKDAAQSTATSISLPVLKPAHPPIKKSKMGPKRASVLIAIHIVFLIHLAQWFVSGMSTGEPSTISPVEPSESMQTLELGKINAGFVFFVLALLSTFIFGRFFCGWGCHIVALQDLCGWMMKKLGVHPKPFRTRLLLLMPLLMGSYMFLWPTAKREIIEPAVVALWGADTYEHLSPFIGDAPPRPDFEPHFIVEDFWETFAPWPIAIPFLLVCGFATVYFLGAKGFCTYGCPYGGFFAPLDKFSPGKIVVNDNCEQCGHCTAVCTSNVRVHEEVRDYGMVVDPGCMKCLDCVSVCPNHALSFGFAKPTILAKPRTPQAKERRAKHHVQYDLTTFEEVWVGAVFFLFTWFGFRGMLNSVPLLMSAGLGAIAAYTTWKLVRLASTPNVRAGHLQLRLKGSFTKTGLVFIPLALALFALGTWGVVVRGSREVGNYWDYWVRADNVFAPNYTPEPHEKAKALRAIRHFTRGDSIRAGGWGWSLKTPEVSRLAWLYAVVGDKENCVKMQERVVELIRADVNETSLKNPKAARHAELAESILRLADFYLYRGDSPRTVEAFLKESALDEPGLGMIHIRVAYNAFRTTNDAAEPERMIRKAIELNRPVPRAHVAAVNQAVQVLNAIGRGAASRGLYEEELTHSKEPDDLRIAFAHYLLSTGAIETAKEQFRLVSAAHPSSDAGRAAWFGEAQAFLVRERHADAIKVLESGLKANPRATNLIALSAQALGAAGRTADAEKQLRRWAALEPRNETPWLNLVDLARTKPTTAPAASESPLDILLEAEKHRGDDPAMLVTVAEELLRANRGPEAVARLRRALDTPPRNPALRAHAKDILTKAGLTKDAESF